MSTPDFYCVALIIIFLLVDYFVLWPAFVRRSLVDSSRARVLYWSMLIILLWALTILGIVIWITKNRAWGLLGLTIPEGWRLWTGTGLVLAMAILQARSAGQVAKSERARAKIRSQFQAVAAILPRSWGELWGFFAVSLTAGFCEEFIFRGYLIWAFQPWLSWWGAAALSAVLFAFGHAYQGASGILRTGLVGVLLTFVVAICGSLWPAILLHALIDVGSGIIGWFVLRENPAELASR